MVILSMLRLISKSKIKSNVGHSEPAAGASGLLKAILSLETGIIPGNPTYEKPNSQSKCQNKSKRKVSRIAWTRSLSGSIPAF